MPLIGGLCLVLNFNQMWSKKICPSSKDFVSQQTSTNYGQKFAPHRRTLSHHGLWPNVAWYCALHRRTLSHCGVGTVHGRWCAPHWRTSSHPGLFVQEGINKKKHTSRNNQSSRLSFATEKRHFVCGKCLGLEYPPKNDTSHVRAKISTNDVERTNKTHPNRNAT